MNRKTPKLRYLLLITILLSGCTVQQPSDTSNPAQSIKWLKQIESKSDHSNLITLKSAYEHAQELEKSQETNEQARTYFSNHSTWIHQLPQRVCEEAIASGNFSAFSWALEQGRPIRLKPGMAAKIWPRGMSWVDLAIQHAPQTLPEFMELTIKDNGSAFFEKYAPAFKASGYQPAPNQDAFQFKTRYIYFIAAEAQKAAMQKDTAKLRFILDHVDDLSPVNSAIPSIRRQMQTLSEYILYEADDETLTTRMIELGYLFSDIDLERAKIGNCFTQMLKDNPTKAVRILGLSKEGRPLTEKEAAFLLKLPINELTNLHDQHIDEAIHLCIKKGGTAQAIQFIQLKAARKPLAKSDYINLMTWSLQSNNQEIYAMAEKHSENISIFELDLAAIADNQLAFKRYAPKVLANIYPTMSTDAKADGITLGNIYRILESPNQMAGLYVVQTYDEIIKLWPSENNGRSLLMDACRAGNLLAAKYLIEKTPMRATDATRHTVSENTLFGKAQTREGKLTPMHFAAESGNTELMKYLKSKGGSFNATSHFGATPLMMAVSNQRIEAARYLIQQGAQINAKMKESERDSIFQGSLSYNQLVTALARAEATQNSEMIKLLKEAGAN
jgi:hypothetical protein